MDVRRAPRIRHRADSPEAVTAVTVGQRMAKALKTGIDRSPPRITRVAVAAMRIALPDLDAHTGQRPAVAIEQPATEITDPPIGDLFLPGDLDQVVIIVEWQFRWVERPRRLTRCKQCRTGRWRQRQCRKNTGGTDQVEASITPPHPSGSTRGRFSVIPPPVMCAIPLTNLASSSGRTAPR